MQITSSNTQSKWKSPSSSASQPASSAANKSTSVGNTETKASETKSTTPVSSSPLPSKKVEKQYEYLREVATEMSGDDEKAWKTGTNEVNLVGIRSLKDGKVKEGESNKYDDTIYAVWVDEEGKQNVEAFHASTDAGVRSDSSPWGYRHKDGTMAHSHVADGFYEDAFVKSGVPSSASHEGTFNRGLAQADDLRIHSDYNNNGVIEDSERLGQDLNGDGKADGETKGSGWGIMFHPGGMNQDGKVNGWSAGCQVIVGSEYGRFQEIVNMASNDRFSYTLVDARDLEGQSALSGNASHAKPQVDHSSFQPITRPSFDEVRPLASSNPGNAFDAPQSGHSVSERFPVSARQESGPSNSYSTGVPGFRGEDKHSQYGPDFQVVHHGPSLPDASGEEILVGLHDNPPVSVNYKPVVLNEKDRKVESSINAFLQQKNALGVDWSQGTPKVKDLTGNEVSVGEAIIQAARANDVDPFELTSVMLQTQQGNPQFSQWTSPLQNPVFHGQGNGPQTTGKPGLDYAFGVPRPEWEGFTNQAYIAAGNFRTKAAYGMGDWWKGSRSGSPQAHFEGAQRARYIQEHGDGFAAGASQAYRELQQLHQSHHGESYQTQYQSYGPDDRPQYAEGGPALRRVSGSSSGSTPGVGASRNCGCSQNRLDSYVTELSRYILNGHGGKQEQYLAAATELMILLAFSQMSQQRLSEQSQKLAERAVQRIFGNPSFGPPQNQLSLKL